VILVPQPPSKTPVTLYSESNCQNRKDHSQDDDGRRACDPLHKASYPPGITGARTAGAGGQRAPNPLSFLRTRDSDPRVTSSILKTKQRRFS
jgi:hypothetical protein